MIVSHFYSHSLKSRHNIGSNFHTLRMQYFGQSLQILLYNLVYNRILQCTASSLGFTSNSSDAVALIEVSLCAKAQESGGGFILLDSLFKW